MLRAVHRCKLIPEDFLFFVSYEFNTFTQMQPVIHNYALTYALAQQFNVASLGTKPHYEELQGFGRYATPAVALDDPQFVTHTYNSVCTRTNQTQSSFNVPSLGRNRKLVPASTRFEFFVFSDGSRIPRYVRIGKKSCISRIEAHELKIVERVEDPSEAVSVEACFNLLDLSPNDVVTTADMLLMYPSPVAKSMTVRAPHVVLEDGTREIVLPIPKHLRMVEG
ncbi:MAG: type I-D CRISPR-associated protein Cas5/Csc1 [Candidatus Thorarchaeota archaeon]|nr:MAG: type I-D CRISPR-associated protein Cas5/Csc1 [Candidatus Thorarchaeota archaeon]